MCVLSVIVPQVNDYYQTSNPRVYACGDVIGYPALASTSMEQVSRSRHSMWVGGGRQRHKAIKLAGGGQTKVLEGTIYSLLVTKSVVVDDVKCMLYSALPDGLRM